MASDSVVPVHIVDDQDEAADFGGWQTYVFAGTEPATQILPFSRKRHRAVLYFVVPAFSTLTVGTRAQVQAGAAGTTSRGGGGLQGSGTIVIENKQELWAAPDGTHQAYLVVLDERWANDSGPNADNSGEE